MKIEGRYLLECSDAWSADQDQVDPVIASRAFRGALREALAASVVGACAVAARCDAAAPCPVCALFGAQGRPGKLSVEARVEFGDAASLVWALSVAETEVGALRGAVRMVREIAVGGRHYRVRDAVLTETGADTVAADVASNLGAGHVSVQLVAETPVYAAGFRWGDSFRWGGATALPGSHLRGALAIKGGRVSHLTLVTERESMSKRLMTTHRAGGALFAEEGWAAGTMFRGEIWGGEFVPLRSFSIGARRSSGYGRVQATWTSVAAAGAAAGDGDAGSLEPLPFSALPEVDGKFVVGVELVTETVVRDRAMLGRSLFGDADVEWLESVVAEGPTGSEVAWVRGRVAIPAQSRFLFAVAKDDLVRALEQLRLAVRSGVGDGAEDGYGAVRIFE